MIKKIKDKYEDIVIEYKYHKKDDIYEILHNKREWLDDEEFNYFLGKLFDKYLYKYNIINFYVAYDFEKFDKE